MNYAGILSRLFQRYLLAIVRYALENNIERLSEDHKRAKAFGEAIKNLNYVAEILPVETNIVIFKLQDNMPSETFLANLKAENILASAFGPQQIRLVTHLDFTDEMLERTINVLKSLN